MEQENLAERFCALWQQCGGANADAVWLTLEQHYQESHRYYHTLAHITHCLGQLDAAREHVTEFNAIETAIWFHDIIYHYGARDNEILSVAFFREVAAPTVPTEFVDRVSEFIIATQHTGAAKDASVAYVVDIDLSGFGLPWDEYLSDSDALRHEANGVSDEHYYRGKLRFLTELQLWPSLFQTAFFRNRLEATAQSNIARYTADLQRQGFGAYAICQA